jgi:hypothetical protein
MIEKGWNIFEDLLCLHFQVIIMECFIMSGKCSMIGFGTGITLEKKQNAFS